MAQDEQVDVTEAVAMCKRLRAKVHRGQYAPGGGTIDAEGKGTTWGGEKIMEWANPDGPQAAELIERLAAMQAVAQETKSTQAAECVWCGAIEADHEDGACLMPANPTFTPAAAPTTQAADAVERVARLLAHDALSMGNDDVEVTDAAIERRWTQWLPQAERIVAALATLPAIDEREKLREAGPPDDVLVEALIKCRDQFREYERQHREKAAKANPGGSGRSADRERLEKAERNRDMADMCDEALTRIKGTD